MEIHAAIMTLGTVVCLYTGFLGLLRFKARRAGGHAAPYTWKRHLLSGRIMLLTVTLGAFLGMREALDLNYTSPHTALGTLALAGALLMMVSGMLLSTGKGKAWPLRSLHMALGATTLVCLLSAPIYLLAMR